MSAAREAQPSEGPQGPTLRESHEADAPESGKRCACKEAEAMSTAAEAMSMRGKVDL